MIYLYAVNDGYSDVLSSMSQLSDTAKAMVIVGRFSPNEAVTMAMY